MAPAEQTHYFIGENDGLSLEVVSVGRPPAEFRSYIGRDDRRIHKTPWVASEEEAWLAGRAMLATERRRRRAGPLTRLVRWLSGLIFGGPKRWVS
jgi:hypothetical protein